MWRVVSLYGENLPQKTVKKAIDTIQNADLLIVASTSLSVFPAADFVRNFQGAHLVVVNRDPIQVLINPDTDICIYRPMGEVFQELTDHLTIF